MADYYVDLNASGANDGTSPGDAVTSIKTALEAGVAAGSKVWIRRSDSGSRTIELPTADIAPGGDGTSAAPIEYIGWPRASASITSATWTNGSPTVDLVVGVTLSRIQHEARYITAPNGSQYTITYITDSNTFEIDREYSGSTVTSTNGAATILADEDYASRPAAGTAAGWDSDADDIPAIDFNDGSYQLQFSGDNYFHLKNMEFKDSADTYGIVYLLNSAGMHFKNCLFLQSTTNDELLRVYTDTYAYMTCCTFLGSGVSGCEIFAYYGGNIYFKDCAINNCYHGINAGRGCVLHFNNVNIGIEDANHGSDIYITGACTIDGIDVDFANGMSALSFGAAIGDHDYEYQYGFENWGKELGAHVRFNPRGKIIKKDVVAGSGTPQKRSGGADSVIQIDYDNNTPLRLDSHEIYKTTVFDHIYDDQAASEYTYTYYVNSDTALTAAQFYIEAEYIDSYDDTTEYTRTTIASTDTIAAAASTSDWTQSVSVTLTPATSSRVRIKLFCNYYHATNQIYVDPKVAIS